MFNKVRVGQGELLPSSMYSPCVSRISPFLASSTRPLSYPLGFCATQVWYYATTVRLSLRNVAVRYRRRKKCSEVSEGGNIVRYSGSVPKSARARIATNLGKSRTGKLRRTRSSGLQNFILTLGDSRAFFPPFTHSITIILMVLTVLMAPKLVCATYSLWCTFLSSGRCLQDPNEIKTIYLCGR